MISANLNNHLSFEWVISWTKRSFKMELSGVVASNIMHHHLSANRELPPSYSCLIGENDDKPVDLGVISPYSEYVWFTDLYGSSVQDTGPQKWICHCVVLSCNTSFNPAICFLCSPGRSVWVDPRKWSNISQRGSMIAPVVKELRGFAWSILDPQKRSWSLDGEVHIYAPRPWEESWNCTWIV